jgi:hypothetical protein
LEEDRIIRLTTDGLTLDGRKCDAAVSYVVRIYPKKLDVMFRGGWQTFGANSAGDFDRTFVSPVRGNKLSVRGNLKTRAVSVENPGNGCVWKGSF